MLMEKISLGYYNTIYFCISTSHISGHNLRLRGRQKTPHLCRHVNYILVICTVRFLRLISQEEKQSSVNKNE